MSDPHIETKNGIADYEFVEWLGHGNHGEVYLAICPPRLKLPYEQVAVKVLPKGASEDGFRRALRELKLFATIDSPYVVQVFDAGQAGDNFYYSLEYFPLGSLAQPIHQLSRAETRRAVAHAALAADVLHESGIVHRDIRPANIMLHNDGAKLADLGMAQHLSPGYTVTSMGPVASAEYTDPEVIRGSAPVAFFGYLVDWRNSSLGIDWHFCLRGPSRRRACAHIAPPAYRSASRLTSAERRRSGARAMVPQARFRGPLANRQSRGRGHCSIASGRGEQLVNSRLSVAVLPGSGTVARAADTVFVCPGLSEVSGLMAVLSEYESGPGDAAAVRRLALALFELVASPVEESAPSYALIVLHEEVATLILSGTARARVLSDGVLMECAGDEAVTWLERSVPKFDSITLSLEYPTTGAYGDLLAGTVAGSGAVIDRSQAPVSFRRQPEHARNALVTGETATTESETTPESSTVFAPIDVDSETPSVATQVSGPDPHDRLGDLLATARAGDHVENLLSVVEVPVPKPLPIGSLPESVFEGVLVDGIDCKNGHFNDPSARFCGQCGIAMTHQTRELKAGERPGLGHLILEDGSTFLLDKDYIIGRDPELDPDVAVGRARPLRLAEDALASRRHAAIRLRGWTVSIEDLGSANGTELRQRTDSTAITLSSGQSSEIQSGTCAIIGSSQVTFVLHNKL